MKQFIIGIPSLGIRIQFFFFFFSGSFQSTDSPSSAGKTLWICRWILPFLCGLSWQFRWLVLRGIQISCWISSIVLLLRMSSNSIWVSCSVQPFFFFFYGDNTHSWFLYHSVSLERSSQTESISWFPTRLNGQALAEWSKRCIENGPLGAFETASR